MRSSTLTLKIINEHNPFDSFATTEKLTERQKAMITIGSGSDNLRRHIDRYDELKREINEVSKNITKTPVTALESVLIFSEHAPMQFDQTIKKMGISMYTLQEVGSISKACSS